MVKHSEADTMVWVKDAELNREETQRFLEPSRVQLMLCDKQIWLNARQKDFEIEKLLATIKWHIAG